MRSFWHLHGVVVSDHGVKITAGEGQGFGNGDTLTIHPIGHCEFDNDGIYASAKPLDPLVGAEVVVVNTRQKTNADGTPGAVIAYKWCLAEDFPRMHHNDRCEGCAFNLSTVTGLDGLAAHPIEFRVDQIVLPDDGGLVRVPFYEGNDRKRFLEIVDLLADVSQRVGSKRGRSRGEYIASVKWEMAVKNGSPWRLVDAKSARELDLPSSAIYVEMPEPVAT